jgi:hypothetical protein
MSAAKKSAGAGIALTDNAQIWEKVRKIAAGKMSIDEAQTVFSVASVASDRSHNVLNAVKARLPGYTLESEPGSILDRFLFIYHRTPDACLQIMLVVRKWHLGLTDIQRALLAESARSVKEARPEFSAEKIADTIPPAADPSKTVDGGTVKRQRTRMRTKEQNFAAAVQSDDGDKISALRSPTK